MEEVKLIIFEKVEKEEENVISKDVLVFVVVEKLFVRILSCMKEEVDVILI